MSLKVWRVLALMGTLAVSASGGVDKDIQGSYIQNYKNRALYLKIPVHGLRQVVHVGAGAPVLDQSNLGEPLAFKVGDQIRITDLDFKDEFIRFKIAAVDFSRQSELIFQFPEKLVSEFPNRVSFDRALDFALTEGLSYREIDTAKETFIADQFDRLIAQFAATTGTSSEYVIKTISEKNPEYQRIQQALDQRQIELAALKNDLEKEQARRREAESQEARSRREFEDQESRMRTLKVENAALADERDRVQRQLRQLSGELGKLKDQQEGYQDQVTKLMKSLDVQTSSSAELGEQVTSLNRVVKDLQAERNSLQQDLETATSRVNELDREKKQLNGRVEQLDQANKKLSGDLRVLTSDKNSIQAAYLRMQREKEIAETARGLGEALQLRPGQSEDGRRISDLYLSSARIGTLEVERPERVDSSYEVRLSLDSPDTVKFSEQERELHAALGEKLTVEPQWRADDPSLAFQLVRGEAAQTVAPRESAVWTWNFTGQLDQPTTVAMSVQVIDGNQQRIQLPSQEFLVRPAGWVGFLTRTFSVGFVGLAFLLGIGLGGLLLYVRTGSGKKAREIRRPEYVTEKRL